MEQLDIRRASDEFADHVEEYRKYFRARAPFAVADPELKLQHVRGMYLSGFITSGDARIDTLRCSRAYYSRCSGGIPLALTPAAALAQLFSSWQANGRDAH